MCPPVLILGAGIAGIRAALQLVSLGIPVCIFANDDPERSQSVMALGGINAALSENDSPKLHAYDTYAAGLRMEDLDAIEAMTSAAPELLSELLDMGTVLETDDNGRLALRAFGGQTRKRTAYARYGIGRQIMHALIQQLNKAAGAGRITCHFHHHFMRVAYRDGTVCGCFFYRRDLQKIEFYPASGIIAASGGPNRIFGSTTGSMLNSGSVTASLFADGESLVNGEFIQFHPTTVRRSEKNMLITEAVRGEGGRLMVYRDGMPFYFMEEKYQARGNLMPRDVVARECDKYLRQGIKVYLDLTHLPAELIMKKLSYVVRDCRQYLCIDPRKEPVPIEPGIHYFMGGLWVDEWHRGTAKGLFAAGECVGRYHGANRLGGNCLASSFPPPCRHNPLGSDRTDIHPPAGVHGSHSGDTCDLFPYPRPDRETRRI